MLYQNKVCVIVESVTLAAGFILAADLAGRYSVVLTLCLIWAAILGIVLLRDLSTAKKSLLIASGVITSVLLLCEIVPSLLACGVAIGSVFAVSRGRYVWGIMSLLPIAGSFQMWLVTFANIYLQTKAPVVMGGIVSAGMAFVYACILFGKPTVHAFIPMVMVSLIGVFSDLDAPDSIAWALCLAMSLGVAMRSLVSRRSVNPLGVIFIICLEVVWWVPYRAWLLPKERPLVVLLPKTVDLEQSVFAQAGQVFQRRFTNVAVFHSAEGWPEAATVIIPSIGDSTWDESFWATVVSQAERSRAHLVILAEHTDINGFRKRMSPIWSTYGISIGDDTTVPRPNRDYLGHVWAATWSPWDTRMALNRGGSIVPERITARPMLMGRDWFADGPGENIATARLGDYRPTIEERLADIVLAAYGISNTGDSIVTVVADNSALIDTNLVMQPLSALQRLSEGPLAVAVYDAFLAFVMVVGCICSSRRATKSVKVVAITILLIGLISCSFLPNPLNEQALPFYEPNAASTGYSEISSAKFRLWWLSQENDNIEVVIGDWQDLRHTCQTTKVDRPILFFGIPGEGEACGSLVESSFRFGRLNVQALDRRIPIQDGVWAHLTLTENGNLNTIIGDENNIVAGTWKSKGRDIGVVFDAKGTSSMAIDSQDYRNMIEALRKDLNDAK